MNLKRIFLKVLCFLLVAAGVSLWRPWANGVPSDFYRTQMVIKNQLRLAVSAIGKLNPVRMVNVGTQVSGTIRELLVDFNDPVKARQLMVVLDDDLFQAKVSMSRANVKTAAAQYRLARIKYERLVKLRLAEATPQEELDTAEANLEIAEATLEQQEAALLQDLYNLNNTKILAPIDGVIIHRAVDVGQTVAASFQTPDLIDIAGDLNQMQINASFVEADVARLKPGLLATITVDAFPGQIFSGVLRQIRLKPTITSNVVTYDVVVDVANPEGRLLPGMTAYVDIELYREDNVILIPNTALSYRPSSDEIRQAPKKSDRIRSNQALINPYQDSEQVPTEGMVYVLDYNGQPKAVRLTLGATDLRYTVVKSGNLRVGDEVIIGEIIQDDQEKSLLHRFGGVRL
jgi:HlyD family secretion protein